MFIVQIDVAKAFGKVDRRALASFAHTIIRPSALAAAAFIESMYNGDVVTISYGKAVSTIAMKSGIRQGDPLSPALFSALIGHIMRPLIASWERKGWGAELDPRSPHKKITILAYADDITLFAATKAQAAAMLNEMTNSLGGINLQLLANNCSALWSMAPNGSDTTAIKLGRARIPITATLVILGQEVAFRQDSMHSFRHRLRQAWKTAHANAILLRSTTTSHSARLKLLQALVKPSLLYGSETWKLTPALLAKIIGAERTFSRWCLRLTNRASMDDHAEGDMTEWIQWRADSAREIAKTTGKNEIERWHITALRLHWQWAGHAARRLDTPNQMAATSHISPTGRGRPPPHWAQLLRSFSIQELRGRAEAWEALAQKQDGMEQLLFHLY